MTRDMAKAMSQHFMDARLIENAADPSSNLFKDRGVYVLTPKGLHVLERFISKNGINSDHLQQVFVTQPICIKLLHLERRSADDEIIVTQSVITALFRRFVGRAPISRRRPLPPILSNGTMSGPKALLSWKLRNVRNHFWARVSKFTNTVSPLSLLSNGCVTSPLWLGVRRLQRWPHSLCDSTDHPGQR